MADSLYENAGLSRTAFIDSTTAYEDSVLLATQDTLTSQMNLSTANQFADDLLQNLHTNIQAAINAATELCNAQFDPASWGEPGVSCYDEILTYGNSWEEQNKMVSEAFHDSASAYVDSLYTVNKDPEWYHQAKWLAFYSSDSVYQHLDAFRVSWMDSAYTACDSIFNYQPADGPALPSDEDCYATISAHHDSAYAYMDSLRMAFTDSAYAYNDSVYVYDNDYGQYEYNLNLISAQSDSIYYFYDAQLMSWNDSAYAYCDSLANSCTDQIMTWQDSIWSYNESIETTMMDSVQAYHHTLFAADHNYIQYLINVNEATSYVDSILDIDRDRFSLQLDSAFAYCDSLNPGEMDPCYGPVQLWMDSTYSYHNSLMSLYLDSANSWNDNDHSNRYQSDINAFIAMAQSYNDSSNNWWSANVITPWGDSTGTFYNSLITALEDSARGWNDTTYTIGDSTHTWNDSIITYKTDSAQAWANQLVIYGTDSLWGEALSGVILWTDSMINWASGIFDSENDSIYMYHEQNIMAWSDSAWTAVNDVVSLYSDSAYAYCDSLYNPPMPADTSCYGLATAYSDSVFMVNDQFRISYIDSAEAYHYEIYLQDDDYQKYLDNYDASILVADSIFLIMENLRYAWMDSAYAYCDSLNNPPLPPDTSCYGLVMTFSDSLYFYNDNLRLTYLDSAYAYNDSVYMATSDSTQYFNANNMAMTFADSTFSFLEMQRNMAVDSAYGYCNELNPDPVSSCYNYVNQVNDSILNYNNNARTLYNDSIYAYSDSVYAWNNDYDLYIATVETGYQYADSIYSLREQQRIAWEDSARASCDSLNYYLMGPCYGPVQAWVDSTYRHYNDVYSEFADSAYTWNSNDFNTRSATAMQSVDSLISYTDSTEYYTLLYSVITVWMDSTNNYHLPIIAATTDSARAWNDSTHTYGDSLNTWYDSTITAQSDSAYYWLNLLTSNWQDSTWSLHYSNFYAWSDSVRAYWNYLYDPYQDSIYLANNNMIYIQTDSIWQFGDALVVTYRDSANAYCDSLTNNPAAQVTPDHSVNTLLTDSYTNTEEWTWNSTVTTPTGPDKLVTEEPYNTNPLQFSVFPNPAHHKIHILYESPTAQEITIYMANLDGSLLHFEKVRIPQGRYTYTFPDLMELASKFTHLQSVVIGLKTQDEDLSEIVLIK
ncbi:MAG TPA: hypothetical protein DIU20_08410 [Cryomorphaceae bacterium]|nr:hypothetical protein [Cryomorphaceae bacterium]